MSKRQCVYRLCARYTHTCIGCTLLRTRHMRTIQFKRTHIRCCNNGGLRAISQNIEFIFHLCYYRLFFLFIVLFETVVHEWKIRLLVIRRLFLRFSNPPPILPQHPDMWRKHSFSMGEFGVFNDSNNNLSHTYSPTCFYKRFLHNTNLKCKYFVYDLKYLRVFSWIKSKKTQFHKNVYLNKSRILV